MNDLLTWVFSVLAAVMLFLHGLSAFSEEMSRIGGERLRDVLRRLTRSDGRAALVGAVFTALVQSSSAVTSMAVGLASKGTLGARGALAVMIGANVGTTLTAWLVALKVSGLGPLFVSIGGAWSLLAPRPWRPYGKALFYFGLIFLALDLVGQALAPLAHSPAMTAWHEVLRSPLWALLFGAVLTAVVQSSSVVSGLAVLAVSGGVLQADVAVWVIVGANVGTTSTALMASTALDALARKLALLNTGFNVLGVLLFATVLQPFQGLILQADLHPEQQVALVHTLFNLAAALVALLALPRAWPRLQPWLGERGART